MSGICYYTDNRIGEPIYSIVQGLLKKTGLPIVSSSLSPIDFGDNEVVIGERGYPTMVRQIISCLERSREKYVFFCENDVLYSLEHFDFIPPKDNVFYYNSNVWRWHLGDKKAINYERMLPLSCLCANREYLLDHYRRRFDYIVKNGWENDTSAAAGWMRKMGFEPGTKKKKRGGFTDDDFETWKSAIPTIDIRHKGAFSPPKCTLESFKHVPVDWKEIDIDKIPGWDLKSLFGL